MIYAFNAFYSFAYFPLSASSFLCTGMFPSPRHFHGYGEENKQVKQKATPDRYWCDGLCVFVFVRLHWSWTFCMLHSSCALTKHHWTLERDGASDPSTIPPSFPCLSIVMGLTLQDLFCVLFCIVLVL